MMKKLLLISVSLISIAIGHAQNPYWSYSFDGGVLTDEQGNNDLTSYENTFTTVNDRFDQEDNAISLDGDSIVGGTDESGSISISFWIKDAPNDANNKALIHHFGKGAPGGGNVLGFYPFGYSVRLQDGLVTAVGRQGRRTGTNLFQPQYQTTRIITGGANIADGEWHHIVYVIDQENNSSGNSYSFEHEYSLYIDGVLEADTSSTIAFVSSSSAEVKTVIDDTKFRVGNHPTGALVRYQNTIDDIQYFNTALTASEVQDLFNIRGPQTIYVDQDASGANDGSSWVDAFTSLKEATDFATIAGDEIWVADGVYKPSLSDRSEFFELLDSVSLYGGFNGTETQLSQRDWRTNQTILSGDLNDNDNNNVTFDEPTRSDNSYRLIVLNGNNILIDGIVIENGQANNLSSIQEDRGSAIFKSTFVSDFTLKNSIIRKNVSRSDGSVRLFYDGVSSNSVLIQSCRFENNFSRFASGLSVISNNNSSTVVEIYNSEFYNNVANDIPNEEGFSGSSLGIYVNDGETNATIVNNTFAFNKDYGTFSPQDKGTLALRRLSDDNLNILDAEIHNNIFYQNEDSIGRVNTNSIGLQDRPTIPINSINFTHNNSGQNNFGTISSGGTVEDNIDLNPEFVDGSNGDLSLSTSSPMIDEGDNSQLPTSITEDIAGNTRIDNSIIDLGANESCLLFPQITETNGQLSTGTFESYQWFLNGNSIDDATNQSFTPTQNGDYTVEVTQNNCAGISTVLTFSDIGTSINTIAFENLKVYPNPANEFIFIEIGNHEISSIKLFDMTGKLVKSTNANISKMDVSTLVDGIYFLEIANNEKQSVVKISIQ